MAGNLNLSSSLRPLLLFFRCIGIHLPSDEEENSATNVSKLSKLKSIHAAICFLFNLSSQVAILCIILKKIFLFETTGEEMLETVTFALILAFDYTNFALIAILCQFFTLTVVRLRWAALIKSFSYLESQLKQQFFVKLRRIILIGLCFIILLVEY